MTDDRPTFGAPN